MATTDTTHHTIAGHLGTAAMLAHQAFDNDQLDPEATEDLCVAAAAQLIEADELLQAQGMTWLGHPMNSPDTLTIRDKAFIDVIESVGLDEATATQVYTRFMAVLERPIQSEIHWGVESLSEVSGIDPWQLKGEWYRARTRSL